jgi:hypothetical protein
LQRITIFAKSRFIAPVAIKIVKATGGQVTLADLGLPQTLIEKIMKKQGKLKVKKEREKAKRAACRMASFES